MLVVKTASELLWEDGERRFCRIWRSDVDSARSACLAVRPVPDQAAYDIAEYIFAHEYALKDYLDGARALRPLELLIRAAGWQPETLASPQEFQSRPRAAAPCCLVLDVTRPGLNGLELQQQLRECPNAS